MSLVSQCRGVSRGALGVVGSRCALTGIGCLFVRDPLSPMFQSPFPATDPIPSGGWLCWMQCPPWWRRRPSRSRLLPRNFTVASLSPPKSPGVGDRSSISHTSTVGSSSPVSTWRLLSLFSNLSVRGIGWYPWTSQVPVHPASRHYLRFVHGRCGVSISGLVLRPLFGPSGAHPRHGSCLVNYASPRFSSYSLPRRLASPGLHLPGTSAGEGLPPLAVSSPRHHSQSFEKLFGPDSDSGLSRDDARDFSFEGFPDPQTGSEVLSPSSGLLVLPPPSCVGLAESSRYDVIHSSWVSSPHEVSPASPQCSRSFPGRRGSRILGRWLPEESSVVV